MTMFLRRARGVVRMALVWAGGWLLMMLPPVLYLLWTSSHSPCGTGPDFGDLLCLIAAWGAATGTIFALGVIVVGRRRGWTILSLPRTISLGVAAGVAVPLSLFGFWWWLMLPVDLPETVAGATVSAAMGGILAATTLVVARRGVGRALARQEEQPHLTHAE